MILVKRNTSYLQQAELYAMFAGTMKVKVKLNIKALAEAVGIANPYQLSDKIGRPYETCRLLWTEQTRRIDLGIIEDLCGAFGVLPGQLFKHEIITDEEPEPEKPTPARKSKKSSKRK